MLAKLLRRSPALVPELLTSKLYNEDTFYKVFLKDLANCQSEVIIESPFITNWRLCELLPSLEKLKERGVRIVVATKDPREHDKDYLRDGANEALACLQRLGIQVIYVSGHHRKLAILDRKVLYEGSLNILSQSDSREVMRRIESVQLAWQMIRFVGVDRFL